MSLGDAQSQPSVSARLTPSVVNAQKEPVGEWPLSVVSGFDESRKQLL
jgi:hypothetical protein